MEPSMEGYVREPVPAGRIRRVVERGDPEFVALTRCDAWREPLL
jgi:hypothetical protein